MELWELAENFNRIFQGNNRGHGEFIITVKKGAKSVGKATTVSTPPSIELWEKHLKGELGIGIVPITENNSCFWGCVDIDQYEELDLDQLSMQLPTPMVLCRSKSGGAHIFIFMQQPTSAALLRKKLLLVARAVGQPNAEIFPKQEQLEPNAIGNWLNMPYFNSDSTTRYCIKSGVSLTAEEFISYVAENALTQQQLVSLKIDSIINSEEDPEFSDAPPCLQYLIKNGFPTGTRNIALFSMGVFAKRKYGIGWEEKVFEYNQRFMGPGTYSEVAAIVRSLNKKTYQYKCKEQPLAPVCNKDQCYQCQYGIQPTNNDEKNTRPCILDEVETPVTCYAPYSDSKDDPYWVFVINGISIDVTIDMIRSQTVFAREYLRQYHRVILPIKDSKWVNTINTLLADAEIKQLAPDAGPEGQFFIHLEDFCTGKAKAKVKDELLLGKPWENDDRVYFRSCDLMKFLDQQRFRQLKEKDIWSILKRKDGKHHTFNLKGKKVSCWSIRMFDIQTESFDMEPVIDDTEY